MLSIIQNYFSWYFSFEEIVYMWKKANTFLTVSWYLQILKSTDSSFFEAIFLWELVFSLRFTLLRPVEMQMSKYVILFVLENLIGNMKIFWESNFPTKPWGTKKNDQEICRHVVVTSLGFLIYCWFASISTNKCHLWRSYYFCCYFCLIFQE